jgi:pimeloyl-ACP methyl ester carboxylesterase
MTLNYERRGSGEPLVLIHGLGSQWQVWKPLLDGLAARHDVIALDLPGFGESPTLPVGVVPGAGALTDAVADFMAELELDRPVVAGNSLGGWIALELAKRNLVRAAVPISPAGFWNEPERRWTRGAFRFSRFLVRRAPGLVDRLNRSEGGRRASSGLFYAHPERIPYEDAAEAFRNFAGSPGYDATFAAASSEHFEDGAAIGVPVTLIWGKRDSLLFPWQARRALAQIPSARHVPLPDAGHVPTWDQPEGLVRLILEAGLGADRLGGRAFERSARQHAGQPAR